MSEMSLDVVIRFKQSEDFDIDKIEDEDLFLKQLMDVFNTDNNLEADSLECIYTLKNHDNFFIPRFVNNHFYIDYVIKSERECYDIDLDISHKEIQRIIKLLKKKFAFDFSDYKIKVLYFYNGGCSGVAEVE